MATPTPPDPFQDPIRPMLAVEGDVPAGSAWAFEFVWDGLRAVAYLRPGRIRLLSGTDRSITGGYPDLAALAELADRHGPLVLDGQIVALDEFNRPSAVSLRRRAAAARPSEALVARAPVVFFPGDVLWAHGGSTVDLPYRTRRELLGELDLTGLPAVRPPYFLDTEGRVVLHAAQRNGLAGVVAKRLDSRYQAGRRSRAWVQTVPRGTRRVLIGGWEPDGDQVGALLVGMPDAGGLRYLARITGGLDRAARRALAAVLPGLAATTSPFRDAPEADSGTRWVHPTLVGEISYRRVDAAGRPRHPAWIGLLPGVPPSTVRDHDVADHDVPDHDVPDHDVPDHDVPDHGGAGPLSEPPGAGTGKAAIPAPGSVSGSGSAPGPGATAGAGSAPGPEAAAGSALGARAVAGRAPVSAAELAALEEAVRLAQAEKRALRAQISQHFLYNTLTTIYSYVRTDPGQARELLLEFAEYTRYSFQADADSTTLAAELANAGRYLALEGARFGDRLSVRSEVPAGLGEVRLPFLSVQTLVENAVRHGIEGTPRGGEIRIEAARRGDDCVLTVAETASGRVGADPDKVAAALTDALVDMTERLRSIPGSTPGGGASLRVDAGAGGTAITLRVPVAPGRLHR